MEIRLKLKNYNKFSCAMFGISPTRLFGVAAQNFWKLHFRVVGHRERGGERREKGKGSGSCVCAIFLVPLWVIKAKMVGGSNEEANAAKVDYQLWLPRPHIGHTGHHPPTHGLCHLKRC